MNQNFFHYFLDCRLYACYTSYIPSTIIEILPVDIKGYSTCYSYQNGSGSVCNKRYTWCSVVKNSSEIYVASIFERTWNPWVVQNSLLTSGVNSMTSNLNMNTNRIVIQLILVELKMRLLKIMWIIVRIYL